MWNVSSINFKSYWLSTWYCFRETLMRVFFHWISHRTIRIHFSTASISLFFESGAHLGESDMGAMFPLAGFGNDFLFELKHHWSRATRTDLTEGTVLTHHSLCLTWLHAGFVNYIFSLGDWSQSPRLYQIWTSAGCCMFPKTSHWAKVCVRVCNKEQDNMEGASGSLNIVTFSVYYV